MTSFDLLFANHGTLWLMRPQTSAGQKWVEENIEPDAIRLGGAIAIEARYAPNIVKGARSDGLMCGAAL